MKGLRIPAGFFVVVSALVFTVGFAATVARAQTETKANWNDSASDWSNVSNWNCPTSAAPCAPNNTSSTFYEVYINAPAPATVGLDVSPNVDGLFLGDDQGSSTAPAQVLEIGVPGTPQTLTLGSSNADAGFGVAANGTVNIADGSTLQFNAAAGDSVNYDVDGAVNIGAGGSGATVILNGNGVAASGNRTSFVFSGDNFNPANATYSGTITLNPNSEIEGATGTELLYLHGGVTFTGQGTVTNLSLLNYGTIRVNSGAMAVNPAPFVYDANGNWLQGGYWNSGELDVSAGSLFNVTGTAGSGFLSGFASLFQGDLSGGGTYNISGVFNYGGGSANTISTIDNGTSVTLSGSGALMTPDGATNGFSTLNTINGSLGLNDGASVGATLASLNNTGTLTLEDDLGQHGSSLNVTGNLSNNTVNGPSGGSVALINAQVTVGGKPNYGPGNALTVGGNYEQANTLLSGSGNVINVAGTFANDSVVTVDAGSSVTVGGALTNVSGAGDLTGGTFDLEGGTLLYHGNNIVSNNGTIDLLATGATGLGSESNGATILLSADGGKTSALDTLTANNGSLYLEGGVTQKFAGAVTNSANAFLYLLNAGNLVQAPGLTNNGSIEVDTGSQLDVTGAAGSFTNVAANTLTGSAYVVGGTLAYVGNAINTIASGASVTLNTANWQINNNFGGAASNALANLSDNEGTFDMANGAAISVSGGLTNGAGGSIDIGEAEGAGLVPNATSTLMVNGALNNQGSFEAGNQIDTPGEIHYGVGNVTVEGLTNGASATLEVDPGSNLTVTGANGGSFTNLSAGTLSGGTYIIGGTFQYSGGGTNTIQKVGANTSLTLENGYNITPDGTTNGIVTLQTVNGTLNVGNPNSSDQNASLATNGAVTNNGALNVMGSNASMATTGNLTNSSTGTVTVDNGGGASLTAKGDFDNNSGGVVNVGASSGTGTVTATGAFNNAGTVSLDNCQSGCSTPSVTVAAANGFSNTGVLEGEGKIAANVTNSGLVTPGAAATGSPGSFDITGNYTQTAAGTLSELIAGTSAGQFSLINATGKVSLAGTLSVSALNGFTFAQGNSFDLFNFPAGDLTGTFGTLQYGSASSANGALNLGNGLELQLAYNNNSVLLNVISSATQDNWIDTTDNWNNSANYATDWSTGAIPTSTQDVLVGTGAGGTVTYNDANDTIASLTVEKGSSSSYVLTFAAGNTLNATNGVTINSGGEIDVETSGAALKTSTLANNGGTLEVGGSGGLVDVTGNLTNDSTSAINVQNGGSFTVGGSLANSGSISTGNASGDTGNNNLIVVGAFTNNSSGSLNLDASGDSASLGPVANSGNVSVGAGSTLAVSGTTLYDQTAGTTQVDGKLTAYSYNAAGGKTLVTNGGNLTAARYDQTGSTANTTVNSGGTLQAPASYDQSAGTTDVDGTLITPSLGLTGGLLTGTGTVKGNVSNTGGTLDPGDEPAAGGFTVAGNYTQGSGGTLAIDINGGSAGDYDVLNVTGAASLGGTLDIMLNNGFLPTNDETFQILTASGGLSGTQFASLVNGAFDTNGSWNVIYGTDTVTLEAKIGQTHITPEPTSLLLLATGLLGLAWLTRRNMRLSA